ncbi:pyruvate formate-lyase 1-activating enzyme [Ruminiclostridium hungatei]|uniref:Pyruvate formate-lyase 1-activating enzyme n=1 Tax=Ruminiclostridium hungatei TaxID=48256 RepID=A0A1V4SQ38_RUMHU|nr:anaerobic ribonucleoside-triphosphate reductase activating protein [Ruminiclostridium hungatei]OPX45893.1 pyruvate formate-lyase 1-activating enzyme [Ruminiclostridium hungatei]
MIISGMVKSSLVDYPGMVSCVLFVPGCNYDCFYCHNRSLLDGTHQILPAEYVEDFLQKRAGLLDAVVITGGEPTLQKGLLPFIKSIKRLGYRIKLDTNGSSPSVVADLLENDVCDYFAVDYKAPAARYEEICGSNSPAGTVLETIRLLLKSDSCFEVRTTVIPQLQEKDLLHMAQELPAVPRYVLNRYRIPDKHKESDRLRIMGKPYSQEEINSFVTLMKKYQPNMAGY